MSDQIKYENARSSAVESSRETARPAYESLLKNPSLGPKTRSLISNDLAVLHALDGDPKATNRLHQLLASNPDCWQAQANLAQLTIGGNPPPATDPADAPVRIAIVSLLFNWPSRGGGTIHTAECGHFLARAGYEVRHFYAVFEPWQLGIVTEPTLCPATPVVFTENEWHADTIRSRFREQVRTFSPDFVIVSDSWNTKPLLCEAVSQWPFCIRLAALECICPLNNVRLLFDDSGPVQCSQNQLASRDPCLMCVQQREPFSGSLHRDDRQLAGYYEDDYQERLIQSFRRAYSVLAVNPAIAALVEPYSDRVRVVPSGFDRSRFPATLANRSARHDKLRVLFAGVTNEVMKGFHVLQQAGQLLWQRRQDFEILATADPIGQHNGYTRFVGWQHQSSLPEIMASADILAFPTIAQEALGRTAVEGMAAGLPVVASRIGGLPTTIVSGETGLLCEPGNPADLAQALERLFDDAELRRKMGRAGRRRFESEFTWDVIIDRHYRSLFGSPHAAIRKANA